MATLYIVATPIGNLRDITLRALDVLASVVRIFCEDKRRTVQLCSHFDIHVALESCRAANERRVASRAIDLLGQGNDIAYVTDAGTPAISDPGAALVRAVRRAGFAIVPIPGASALTALASVSGAASRALFFEGFLSPKAGRRRRRLQKLLDDNYSFVLFESPYRLGALLTDIEALAPQRILIVGRELTKLHEEIKAGTATELRRWWIVHPAQKGEITLLVIAEKSG